MKNKSCCCRADRLPATSSRSSLLWLAAICVLAAAPLAVAVDAPPWMHALVAAPVPAHDEKTDAVLMYSERNVSVQSIDKIRIQVREAYKILRPSGREYGMAAVSFNPHKKINGLRGWCIPASGKDYEVRDKEAIEIALPKIEGSELISDVKDKLLRVPAPDPGNIIGFEYEEEIQPMVLQDMWDFQREIPGREIRYSLQLPPGWEFKANWLNYPESQPTQPGSNQWQWVVNDVK